MNNRPTTGARRWSIFAGWVHLLSGLAIAGMSFLPSVLQAVTRLAIPKAGPPDLPLCMYAAVAGGLTAGFGDRVVRTFTAIARFGSARDVLLDELRVELIFPADDESARFFVERAAG